MSDDVSGTGLYRSPGGDREEGAIDFSSFPSPGAHALALDEVELDRVVAALDASRSPATRRAYATAWRLWSEWSAARGATAMPADPVLVAAYVTALAEAGRAMASIDRALSAISAAHLDAGHSDPTRHPGVVRRIASVNAISGYASQIIDRASTVGTATPFGCIR